MATVTVTPAGFRKAARWAKPSGTPVIPVLGNVRVSVTGSQLVVAWFDWETCLLARLVDPGASPGNGSASVLVPADQLTAALAAADGPGTRGPVEVTVHDGDKIDLVRGAGTAKAQRVSVGQSADPAAYPKLPDMPGLTGWVPSEVFVPAVTQVAGCCSDEPVTPLVCAVHFIPGAETLELQGTNRHILAVDEVAWNPGSSLAVRPPGFLVPAKLAVKFARGCDGPVFIGAPGPDGFVLLSDGWHTMVTKATGGDYPALRTVLDKPPPPAAVFTVDAAKLAVVAGEAGDLLAAAVAGMVDAAVADESDERKDVDKRRAIHHEHDNHGMFITASRAGVEVFAVHPATGAELGRWHVAGLEDPPGGEVTVSLNPGYLTRVLPPEGPAVVTLSGPAKNVRVTVPGTAYEGVACPIKLTPPVREEANA
jgi:DNA polymerase-3 subunit beta